MSKIEFSLQRCKTVVLPHLMLFINLRRTLFALCEYRSCRLLIRNLTWGFRCGGTQAFAAPHAGSSIPTVLGRSVIPCLGSPTGSPAGDLPNGLNGAATKRPHSPSLEDPTKRSKETEEVRWPVQTSSAPHQWVTAVYWRLQTSLCDPWCSMVVQFFNSVVLFWPCFL